MFHVKFFTFYFLVLFSQLQANNPPIKNTSLQKVIHLFQLPHLKNTTQTDSLPLHKKSHIAVLIAQQVEKSRSLELKTKSEAKIFDIHSIQSHIVYVIDKFKELCIKLMTSACEKDSGWVQLEDVYFNGRYYRYHVLSDAARKETKWDSCNLWPYDDSMHCLSFDDRAEFEAALRGGASVAQIYQLAGLSSDGSPYSGEMRVSNFQASGSSSGRSSKSSQDLTPSKGTSTGGTTSGQQNGSSTASQSCGASSSSGLSSGNSGSLSTGTSGIYDINPSKQQPVQQARQQSLSSSTVLQTVDAQDAVTKNSIQQQDFNTLKKVERGFSQKYPDLAGLIIKDREEVLDAHNGVRKIQKAENPGKWVSFFGRKPEINDSYTAQQVQQAQLIVKAGQQNPHSHRQQVLNQAHKIVQIDAAAKAEALKIEQERIAAEKKAADEKKAFDDQQSKLHEIQKVQDNNQPRTSFDTQVLNSVVAAYKKNCDEGGPQRREYERKMQEEQQSITHQRYIQQQKAQQHRASIIQDKYTQQRKIEIAYLDRHGYTYQPSEQDLIELTIYQLRLESARNRYNSMNTLSYDYLMSSKATELKKNIQDSDAKVHNLQNKITKQRYEWDKRSLQEIADKKKSEKIVPGQAKNARNESAHELLDVEKIDDIVDVKNLTEYVHRTDDSISSQDLVKDSEHRYTMPSTIAQAIRNKFIDRDNEYSNKVSADEIAMIDYMLHAMVKAQNNMTVEYAQAGLQACDDAQHAKTDEEYIHQIKKAELYYNNIKNGQANYSIADKAAPVKASDLDAMLQNYNNVLESNKSTTLPKQQQTNNIFVDRFEKRVQAITESQEQLRTNKLISCDFKMSSQARGYLMANNLNYAAFDTIKATSIQHCLTRENLEIIESVTAMAQRHGYTLETKEFVKQVCDLAIAAQQLNQQSKIQEAAALTDINAFLSLFGQSSIEIKIYADIARGVVKGTAQVLYKWHDFLKRLGSEPRKTLGQIGSDLQTIGRCINYAAAEIYEHTPMAYHDDNLRDVVDFIHNGPHANQDGSKKSRKELRDERNNQVMKNGTAAVLHASFNIVTNIINKSFEDNIADITEFTLDGAITNKVTQGIFYLSKVAGTSLIEAGREISQLLPPKKLEETIKYMQTSSGELVAVLEKTGENLATIATQHAIACSAEKIAQIGSKIKRISDKVGELTKPNQKNIDALKKSMESHLNFEKVLNPERLKTIKDIPQINLYREYTNNFSPEGLAKLKPEEILHLNLCEWLEPQARKINERIKQAGLKITEVRDGIQCVTEIHEFDLFHSLLGDVKPGSIRSHTSGGHLMIPELKGALLDIAEIKHVGNEFFDMAIQYAGREADAYINKTFFPFGTSVEEAVEMVERSIKMPKKIDFDAINNIGRVAAHITDTLDNEFGMYIYKGVARFYPMRPIK